MPLDSPDFAALSSALTGSPVTIFYQDAEGRFVWFENIQSIWASQDLVGMGDEDVFDPGSVRRFAAAKERAEREGDKQTVELTPLSEIVADGLECWIKVTVEAVHDDDGTRKGYLCASLDITLEKQRERTLKSLLREVSHRSKNMLAMVLGLSAQTARTSRTIDGFLRAFSGRVQSLAKSQDVITESNWTGARYRDLVTQQVLNVVQRGGARIEVAGENPVFTPGAALHVGLALHELVTKSLVHGVLVQPGGRIVITCQVVEEAGMAPEAVLTWHETPGRVPEGDNGDRNFGRTMLERIVPAAVNGTGALTYSPQEVLYRLTIASNEFH